MSSIFIHIVEHVRIFLLLMIKKNSTVRMQCTLLIYSLISGPLPIPFKVGRYALKLQLWDYLQGSRSLMHRVLLNGRNHLGLNCCYQVQKSLSSLLLALILPILGISPMYVILCILVWLGIAAPALCKPWWDFYLFNDLGQTVLLWLYGMVLRLWGTSLENKNKETMWKFLLGPHYITIYTQQSPPHSRHPKDLDLSGMASLSDLLATPRTCTLKE